jgi:alpha-L-arabinofuranosidase
MFSVNRGTHVLNMVQDDKPLTGQQGIYATAAFDKYANEIILKLVNTTNKMLNSNIILQTSKKVLPNASLTVLQHEMPDGMNSIENPAAIHPVEQEITLNGKKLDMPLDPYSFSIVRIKL